MITSSKIPRASKPGRFPLSALTLLKKFSLRIEPACFHTTVDFMEHEVVCLVPLTAMLTGDQMRPL